MEKHYSHKKIEKRIYSFWEKGGYFKPNFKLKKRPFSILMPPPNANGPLHIGHAVFVTLEDILIRFWRMHQKPTLWLPGFDHAGFETQVVYEKSQISNFKSRKIKKEKNYGKILAFCKKNIKIVRQQLKSLGASADWSREKFTLDRDIVKIVFGTFKKLYKDKLLYRGERIINWCPYHQTSLSNLEIKHKEIEGRLWYIRYPLKKNSKSKSSLRGVASHSKIQRYIVVATTRPETILGDSAIAVHPKDKRYKELIDKTAILPIICREIPIVADRKVDKNFGTGAVKVTPAHDPDDFEIAKHHNLLKIKVIEKDGKMARNTGKQFKGLTTLKAREKIIRVLKKQDLLEKEEPYKYTISLCYKCETPIEPLISKQWFIKIKPLADKAVKVVKEHKIRFYPKRYRKVFLDWMENIYDWNISRQIIWGIKIPVWYCKKCTQGIIISEKTLKKCPYCKGQGLIQESDVFDTWFSSGQWPFAALGYPRKKDFKIFYPTTVMETGWDILFFWVARMIMLSLYVTGKVPFFDVVLHGLVRDRDRQKMSKSRGNIIDPLGVIFDYGADALRMALVFGSAVGSDVIISQERVKGQRNFANKIWNAARFVLLNLGKDFNPRKIKPKLTPKDRWIFNELAKTKKRVTKSIENYQFHLAVQDIYHFFWHKFCDKTIEDCKRRIQRAKSKKEKETPKWVLWKILYYSIKLLHPFMPFVTEEIYQKLPLKPQKALIVESW